MFKARSVFVVLLALVLAAFATQTIAASPTKQFAAAFPATVPNGTGIEIKVTFFNLTPNGNSYINSVELFPAPGVQFTGAVRTAAGSATGTLNGTALIINNFPGIGPSRSLDFYVTVNVTVSGCTSQSWPVPLANAGNSLQGDSFTPLYNAINPATGQPYMQLSSAVGCDGVLACGDTLDPLVTGAGVTEAFRGIFNKDGSACVKVGYDFTNNINGGPIPPLMQGNDVLLQWDVNSQPGGSFTYTAYWKPEWAGANGLPTSQTKMAWFVGGTLIAPVPGRACLSASLPAPYGTVNAYTPTNATSGVLQIKVPTPLPANWATAPTSSLSFPLEIGVERLQATFSSQSSITGFTLITYNVLRQQGGTAATDLAAAVLNAAYAMSTPLPLDDSSQQMRMCIVDEGFTVVDPSRCPQSTASNPPVACVQKSTKANDLGDGYMIGN